MRILIVLGFLAILWQDRSVASSFLDNALYDTLICKDLERTSPLQLLKRIIFCSYDSTVRPTMSHRIVNNVTMKLLPKIVEFDELSSTMVLHSWMTLTWVDAFLTWTPSEYGGINFVHVRSDEIWIPDISVYNSGDMAIDQNGIPLTTCLVFSSGSISCVPALKHVAKCATDFISWPYDTHHCRINLGSWAHSGEEVNFHLDKKGYQMEGFTNSTEWDFKVLKAYKVLKKYKCCPNDTYPMIVYEFSISRHYGILHATYVTPAVAMMLLTLTVLWLDSRSTERMAVASVNLICHMLCIFDLHWQLPHNGVNPPSIMLYYRDSMALAVFALVLTALLRKVQDMSIEVPYWISTATSFIVSNPAGRFLILTNDESKLSSGRILGNETEETSDLPKTAARSKESAWRQFAAIIEWLSFFAVIFTYIVILITLVPYA